MKTMLFLAPFILLFGACSLLVEFQDEKTPTERDCDDERDNDGDGFTDCEDQDCETDEACTGPNVNNFNNFNNMNNVIGPEICDDGDDNDGDGFVDCGDPDCFGPECNVQGETDCGDGQDNDADGMTDCEDLDCMDGVLCNLHLRICNDFTDIYNNWTTIYYYSDIYFTGSSADCPEEHFCTIKPEVSWLPYCYPFEFTEVAPAYQPCGPGLPCGTGMICTWSDKLSDAVSSEVCLPLCAPGLQNGCVGGTGVCYHHWTDVYDPFLQLSLELWLCDHPGCNPMNTTVNGCTQNQVCYPATDLMGDAACHPTSGTVSVGGECSGDDLRCVPGAICRLGPDDGNVTRCHSLCIEGSTCGNGSPCIKEDSRQRFGFCP